MKIQIFEAIKQGIYLSFKNKVVLTLLVLYSILLTIFDVLIINPLIETGKLNKMTYPPTLPVLGLNEILTIFAFFIVSIVILFIIAKVVFENLNKREISISDAIISALKKFIPLFIATVIFHIIVLVGLALLIIPGIFLSIALSFYSYAILLNNQGIIASFKESYNIIKGNWWQIFALFLVFTVAFVLISLSFSLLSGIFLALFPFFGAIISLIIYFILGITIVIYTIVYFQLIGKEEKVGRDVGNAEIV